MSRERNKAGFVVKKERYDLARKKHGIPADPSAAILGARRAATAAARLAKRPGPSRLSQRIANQARLARRREAAKRLDEQIKALRPAIV